MKINNPEYSEKEIDFLKFSIKDYKKVLATGKPWINQSNRKYLKEEIAEYEERLKFINNIKKKEKRSEK